MLFKGTVILPVVSDGWEIEIEIEIGSVVLREGKG